MINRILERFETEKAKGYYDHDSVIGEKNVWAKAISIVKEESQNGGWIPCSERLPEDSRSVITYTKEGGVAEGSYSRHSEEWTVFRWNVRNANVIAWMPLPEPYKGW